ncbi:hypothetical protein SDRG_09439 [Saprolegnia diclina VS20]|uniref:PX domain-containing protein n=1 Tax=Saprolegnia diclina (strain VS20) TaxID=1156394 RepID=T0RKM5_SAPDV|nr:hypothetical protein SDRG_09439 [Saprolegnia diclina VS20]EQC32908.1 hypothetical protein SDRG_09439 [Saprolegnia diclina VS20]|eukprot:XP_008613594.1 hypothetical protein SDRG_09439 [Saprolegnia diclina VS20]
MTRPTVSLTDSPVLEAKNATLRTSIEAHVAWHGDPAMLADRDRLTHDRDRLRSTLARAQDIRLATASVVGCRKRVCDGAHCAEFRIQVDTVAHGTLYTWHTEAKFRALALVLTASGAVVPDVPSTEVRRFTETALRERMQLLDNFLSSICDNKALEWGVRVHDDICVFQLKARAKATRYSSSQAAQVRAVLAAMTEDCDVHDEFKHLRARLAEYTSGDVNKILAAETSALQDDVRTLQRLVAAGDRIYMLSARVVESRKVTRHGRHVDEYQLAVETNSRGTLTLWHRYCTLYHLRTLMLTKYGDRASGLPSLPKHSVFTVLSEACMIDRVAKLNAYLEAAMADEKLQWGLRVDDDTRVFKYQKPRRAHSRVSVASTAGSSDDDEA